MYSIVGSHLCIPLVFSSSSRGAEARFRRYNSRTHYNTKKATKNIYGVAWFLAHLRERTEPVFLVITLLHRLLTQEEWRKRECGRALYPLHCIWFQEEGRRTLSSCQDGTPVFIIKDVQCPGCSSCILSHYGLSWVRLLQPDIPL